MTNMLTPTQEDLEAVKEAWRGARCPHNEGAVCLDCIATRCITAINKRYEMKPRSIEAGSQVG